MKTMSNRSTLMLTAIAGAMLLVNPVTAQNIVSESPVNLTLAPTHLSAGDVSNLVFRAETEAVWSKSDAAMRARAAVEAHIVQFPYIVEESAQTTVLVFAKESIDVENRRRGLI